MEPRSLARKRWCGNTGDSFKGYTRRHRGTGQRSGIKANHNDGERSKEFVERVAAGGCGGSEAVAICMVEKIEQHHGEGGASRAVLLVWAGTRAVKVERACQAMDGCGVEGWGKWMSGWIDCGGGGEGQPSCTNQRFLARSKVQKPDDVLKRRHIEISAQLWSSGYDVSLTR